jgi:hypothetical protein
MKNLGKCKSCLVEHNFAQDREVAEFYRLLLEKVRHRELLILDETKESNDILTLMQEVDLAYLVTKIWGQRSCVSGNKDQLNFIRWNKHQVLSPWNCVLLDAAEVAVHEAAQDVTLLYSADFVRAILQKHEMAKTHFGQLTKWQNHF